MKYLPILLLLILSFSVYSQNPGSLDPSFNGTGIVTTSISNRWDRANDLAIQTDGKIVVVGSSNVGTDGAIVRYNPNGSLDTSFNGTGIVITHIDNSSSIEIRAVALQSDGKIVVAGESFIGSEQFIIIIRYKTDGSLDTSFGGTGIVITAAGNGRSEASDVAIQADGKIVIVGYSTNELNHDIVVARYNTDGSLDTSFNGSGILIFSFGDLTDDYGLAVAIQPDGKIIAGGASFSPEGDFALVRLNPNGTFDTSFDGDGKVLTSIGASKDIIWSVALQRDGKIVVAGDTNNPPNNTDDFALARYNPNGSLDVSFGNQGIVISAISSGRDQAFGLALQQNEKIVVSGYSNYSIFTVARYHTNGSLDSAFGTNGIAFAPGELSRSVEIQSDGKIVAVGDTSSHPNGNFIVARYFGDPVEPIGCSFSVSPSQNEIKVPAIGGIQVFQISTGDSCEWNATSNAQWIYLAPRSGVGNGTVSVYIFPNFGRVRSATITIAGRTFRITQESVRLL